MIQSLFDLWVDDHISVDEMDIQTCKEIYNMHLPVLVWGTGIHGRLVSEILERNGISISGYVVGKNFFKPNQFCQGHPIHNVHQINTLFNECCLVLAANEISSEFQQILKFKEIKKIFCFERICTPCEISSSWIKTHLKQLNEVYQILADDLSQKTFISYLHGKSGVFESRTKESKLKNHIKIEPLWKLMEENQYFNNLYNINIHDRNILVDVGAYTGDTAEQFINYAPNAKIYAFEPEFDNYKILLNIAKKYDCIKCYNMGLSDIIGNANINANGSASQIMETTDDKSQKIQITIGDDLLENVPVTFIKMDVEGFECRVLNGLSKTIRKHKPFLAICVYHLFDDLITIPNLIMRLTQPHHYKFFLRNHTPCCAETVFYACPDEQKFSQ